MSWVLPWREVLILYRILSRQWHNLTWVLRVPPICCVLIECEGHACQEAQTGSPGSNPGERGGGSDQGQCSGNSENWTKFEQILNEEPTGFPARFDGDKRENHWRRLQGFYPEHLEEWSCHQLTWGKAAGRAGFGEKVKSSEVNMWLDIFVSITGSTVK